MSNTYRKLIKHVRTGCIIHRTNKPTQEGGYRVDLHHSMPLSQITEELTKHEHKIRNLISVRRRVSRATAIPC